MNTLIEFLDAARQRNGLDSDRKLSVALGLSNMGAHNFRLGKAYPSDDTMVRLSQLAGVDPERGLLLLNLWRARSASVSEQYSRLLQRLAPVLALFALVMGGSSSVHASTITEHPASNTWNAIYYQKYRHYLLLARAYIRRMHQIYLVTS